MNEQRKAWKARCGWMTAAEQDSVELVILRYLEKSSGYPRTADAILDVVTFALEPWKPAPPETAHAAVMDAVRPSPPSVLTMALELRAQLARLHEEFLPSHPECGRTRDLLARSRDLLGPL